MTASITPCWKNCRKGLEFLFGIVTGLLWLGAALAGVIEPKQASLTPDDSGHALMAEFVINIGPRLEEAAARGVTLHFRLEFTLARKRWYWADEHIVGRTLDYKLGYQALTRQYRLSSGSLQQNFDRLEDALRTLAQVGRLHVTEKSALVPGEEYRAAVRLSLDHGQLPKPLQVDGLTDRDWRVEAKTHYWNFVATPEK